MRLKTRPFIKRIAAAFALGIGITLLIPWATAVFDDPAASGVVMSKCAIDVSPSNNGFAWYTVTCPNPLVTCVTSHILTSDEASARLADRSLQLVAHSPPPQWATSSMQATPPALNAFPDRAKTTPFVIDEAFGWPWRSMAHSLESFHLMQIGDSADLSNQKPPGTIGLGNYTVVPDVRGGFDLKQRLGISPKHHYLPTRVLWIGLLANVTAWTLVSLVFTLSPFAFATYVQRRRSHAGKCRKCGYVVADLSSDRCPECGALKP